MNHTHSVVDTDKHFAIDAITRKITTQSDDLVLMQGDHNSEIYTFEIPKMIEGHDMSLCNRVEVHYNNISSNKVEKSSDVYTVTDLSVAETDPEKLVFNWLLSGNATKYAGALGFRVRFCCIDENGVYTYKWHTDVYKGISVSEGFDNTAALEEDFSDAFSEWEARLEDMEEAIEKGGYNVEIPENIETTDNKIDKVDFYSTEEQYPSAKAVRDLDFMLREEVLGQKVFKKEDFTSGEWTGGTGITETNYWIVNKTPKPVEADSIITIIPSAGYRVWCRVVNNIDLSVATNIYNNGVATSISSFKVPADGWLVVQIARIEYETLTPDDCDCFITLDERKLEKMEEEIQSKQDLLVSGENIKTINGQSILDEGDLVIEGGNSPKVFERIATVTVSPDESGNLPTTIIFNKDENGNAFELTDIYCDMSIGFTDGANARFYIVAGANLIGNANLGLDATLRKWWFRYDSYGVGNGGLVTAPDYSSVSNFPTANCHRVYGQPIPVGKTLNISNVQIIVNTGTAKTFIEGTTITLWGVRK